MAQNDVLINQYGKQQVVRDRNSNSLLMWASYISNEQMPTEKPSEEWVQLRLIAERIPQQLDNYVARTLGYFQADPVVVTNIRAFMNPWNDDSTETSLSGQNADIIGNFMPKFAKSGEVTDQQVQDWYLANGFA